MRAHQETLEESQRLGHTLEGPHQHLWTETGSLGTSVCSQVEVLCDRKSTDQELTAAVWKLSRAS